MKKVSVGEVKNVGAVPGKSRKKGFIILIVVAVVLIVLFMIGNTGCSNKKGTDTTPKATIVPVPQRLDGLESRVTYLEQHPVLPFDPAGLQAQISAIVPFDPVPLTTRISTLEALNISTFAADLTFINTRLAAYDSYNISVRLAALEARPLYVPTPMPTATPVPNASVTPTPTPSGNMPPTILSLTAVQLGLTNQSWMVCCSANDSFGDVLHYNWATTTPNYYPLTSGDCVIWNLTTNGTQSITCMVSDGKGGYDVEIKSVVW